MYRISNKVQKGKVYQMMDSELFQRVTRNISEGDINKPKKKAIRRLIIHISGDMELVRCNNCVRVNGYVVEGRAGNCAYIDGDISKEVSASGIEADTVDILGTIQPILDISTYLDIPMPKPGNPLYIKPKGKK